MAEGSPSGPTRLGGAGIGSIGGGVALGVLSVVSPYVVAAAGTVVVGFVVWALNRRDGVAGTGVGLGCLAVGTIGLLEALGLGIGLAPLFLAAIAVGAGLIDVLVGGTIERFRPGS